MSLLKNKSGFSVIELVVVVAVVGLVAFLGYTFYNKWQDNSVKSTEQSSVATDVPAAPKIETVDDLDAAESTLDGVQIENSDDSSQLDSELSAF